MNNKLYIGIIVVLTAVVGFLAYKVYTQKETIVYVNEQNQIISDERETLALDLEMMRMSYDTLQTDNEEMITRIEEQRTEIEKLIKKAKNKDYDLSKLKKETETLRTIMKGYIHTIDSLNIENERLLAERNQMEGRAVTAEERSKQLEQDVNTRDEVINKGSVLSAGEFTNTGVFVRSNGKEEETDRASRAEGLKSCFTVRKNQIVKPGARNVYLRIIAPDGKVLPNKSGSPTIKVGGTEEVYSVSREIEYQNNDLDVCVYYEAQGDLAKGSYKIFIYENGNTIGSTDVVLR